MQEGEPNQICLLGEKATSSHRAEDGLMGGGVAQEGKGRETFQELTPTVWVREFVDLKKAWQVGLLKERCSGETCPCTGPATGLCRLRRAEPPCLRTTGRKDVTPK